MKFNEDTRVKIPSVIHLTRLGYNYISLKGAKTDESTNIFTDIFIENIIRINKSKNEDFGENEAINILNEIKLILDYEDLGREFYKRLISKSGSVLIDYENFENNSFHVVTELTYKKDDNEFRPDITLLINGMPLVFIEVKKPNNKEGIFAEIERINTRSRNKKFRKFFNITQLMVFSNNMEYDLNSILPLQGAFYATTSYDKPIFNYFREEENLNLKELLTEIDEKTEDFILHDNNFHVIKHNEDFILNKDPQKPTNRILTSLFSKSRLSFIFQYGLAYVDEFDGIQKHIMRYPQLFATKAIENKLDNGIRKGIIWHTQGSGKTALTYYNIKFLTDYFQKKQIIAKFYFIVDRLDLLIQAKKEFSKRGLKVVTVNSKEEFVKEIKNTGAITNLRGELEITVVNIQKFSKDSNVIKTNDYDINIQRIYFLDEVHRSYNPKGSFLANLIESDPNSIKIGLTGTPLLNQKFKMLDENGKEVSTNYNSKDIFGNYIHKYYYNSSIADGYTLRLMREEIQSNYKIILKDTLKQIEILKGEILKKEIYSHQVFVEPMLDYIITDFQNTRERLEDSSIGGMVICDSSEQAKMMYEIFNSKYSETIENGYSIAAETTISYKTKLKNTYKVKSAELILHDIGDKEFRREIIDEFKEGKIDLLFVYNMLLTGFDAPRLKKLYLGRVIKQHNLLQALTRVNRTYKSFRYGYIVDFADITKEFDATNKAYFDELQEELGDDLQFYSNIFKTKEEIDKEITEIQELLFHYDLSSPENFSSQISLISDKEKVKEIKKVLENAKALYNIIRLQGHYELAEKLDFEIINILYRETDNHLNLLNDKDTFENEKDNKQLLNLALEEIIFKFTKIKEEELVIADQLKESLRKTRETFVNNFDKNDPQFTTLYDEFIRIFESKKLDEISHDAMKQNISSLKEIHEKIKELNRQNDLLKEKYENDKKYARIHKRIKEKGNISDKEIMIFNALKSIKNEADNQVLQNQNILRNEGYFNSFILKLVVNKFSNENKIKLNPETSKYINNLIIKEYLNEFNGLIA